MRRVEFGEVTLIPDSTLWLEQAAVDVIGEMTGETKKPTFWVGFFCKINLGGLGRNRTTDTRIFNLTSFPCHPAI
jgi:hypothetical protein